MPTLYGYHLTDQDPAPLRAYIDRLMEGTGERLWQDGGIYAADPASIIQFRPALHHVDAKAKQGDWILLLDFCGLGNYTSQLGMLAKWTARGITTVLVPTGSVVSADSLASRNTVEVLRALRFAISRHRTPTKQTKYDTRTKLYHDHQDMIVCFRDQYGYQWRDIAIRMNVAGPLLWSNKKSLRRKGLKKPIYIKWSSNMVRHYYREGKKRHASSSLPESVVEGTS